MSMQSSKNEKVYTLVLPKGKVKFAALPAGQDMNALFNIRQKLHKFYQNKKQFIKQPTFDSSDKGNFNHTVQSPSLIKNFNLESKIMSPLTNTKISKKDYINQ